MTIRILFITDFLVAGGIEHQLTQLATRLDTNQYEPHVLCLYGEKAGAGRFEAPLHFKPALEAAGIPVHVLDVGLSAIDKLKAAQGILKTIRQLKPHIVHTYNYHSNMLSRAMKPLYPAHTRLIGTLRIAYTRKQLLYTRLTQWACDKIVTLSPFLADQLTSMGGVPEHKVMIIPNGIDIERFRHNPQPRLRTRLTPDANRVLVMIGRVSEQKAQPLLVQAVGQLKMRGEWPEQTFVLLVGEREHAPTQQKIEQNMAHYALGDIVLQQPKTDQPEAYFHLADVTVLPSLWEGLPNVALESLAVGRPVIISEAANRAHVIEHAITGWVVRTGDVEHLAQTLQHVLSLDNESLDMMRDACAQVSEHYHINNMVNKYQSLYDILI